MSILQASRISLLATVILALSAIGVSGQFEPAEPLNDHDYEDFIESIYSKMAARLNADFSLPEKVYLTSASCGQVNAFYDPEGNQIVLCSELVEAIFSNATSTTEDEALQVVQISAQLQSALYHELGHALIDVLDLPVLGGEEDASDRLASILLSEEPMFAVWASDFWRSVSGFGAEDSQDFETFTDSHGMSEQRYYNTMCWAYGADPEVRGYVVTLSELPLNRAENCENEYDVMASSWGRVLAPYLRDPTAFSKIDPRRNASGVWSFLESKGDETTGLRCIASGTVGLWQAGGELTGSMTQEGRCAVPGSEFDNSGEFGLLGGIVRDNQLAFRVSNDFETCDYAGEFEGPNRFSLRGQVNCTIELDDGVLINLLGSWSALR